MNAATATPAKISPSKASWTWNAILILIPLLTAAMLFLLRQMEVHRLSNRPLPALGTLPNFQFVNQDGKNFGAANLRGKIWIADFIYTTCPGPCPMISTRMSELEKPLRSTDVQLVSFSVDPENDTPKVLREYAGKLNATPNRWNFLTGPKGEIYSLSHDGFKLGVSDGSDETGVPVHSTRFVLVDRNLTIRGYYDALDADSVTKLLADTNHLLREQPR